MVGLRSIRGPGSCHVYIKGPNNPSPKVIQAQVVDVDGSAIIGNMSAQSMNLLKLNWPITVESIQSVMHSDKQAVNSCKSTNLHTVKLLM